MNLMNPVRRNFTLIELLVVIGIIGILMAILIPTVGKVRHNGFVLESQSTAIEISNAVNRYYIDYGKLPKADDGLDSVDQIIDATLLDVLNGNNSRGIRYYANTGSVKNPWNGDFYISMDGNGDNQISADGNSLSGNVAVYTKYQGETMGSWQPQP